MGILSITNASPASLLRRNGFVKMGNGDTSPSAGEAYVANLAKLIPGDIIALHTLAGQLQPPKGWEAYHVVPLCCALVLVIVRALATRESGKPRWSLVGLSLATFICWVYVQGDWFWTWQFDAFGLYIANLLLLVLAFLAPAFAGEK